MLTKTEYTISKNRLKEELRYLWDGGNKIAAIRLIRAVTDMGLKEAKDYCDGGFVDVLLNGTKVKVGWVSDPLYIQASWVGSSGVVHYWLKNFERDEISTYNEVDVELYPEDSGENQ